jgi:hypothetical protein
MLVYIAVAYAVNSLASCGICNCFSSSISGLESLMYEGIRCSRSFILKSSHVLKMD